MKPYTKDELEHMGMENHLKYFPAQVVRPHPMEGMSEQRQHHDYSPSTLQSLEACPCWQGAQSKTPHPRTLAGTVAHAVVESGDDDDTLSDEDAEAAAFCIEFVSKRRRMMEVSGPVLFLKEEYFPIDARDTTAGYVDVALLDAARESAEIIDHKFGIHKVEDAASNLQGIGYALGLFYRFPTLKQVKVFFVQPHANYVTEALFKREQVPELYLRVKAVVERARIARLSGSFENANPTTPNCLFCANIGRCPALLSMALQIGKKFHPLSVPDDINPSTILDLAHIKQALQLAAVLKVWSEAFRQAVTNRVLCGGAPLPEGYKLESRSKREIVDAAAYRAVALSHLTDEEYQTTLSPSLTKVEKIISTKAPRGQKTETVAAFAQAAEDAGATVRGESFTFLKVSTDAE